MRLGSRARSRIFSIVEAPLAVLVCIVFDATDTSCGAEFGRTPHHDQIFRVVRQNIIPRLSSTVTRG